jgi:hypothetical protein
MDNTKQQNKVFGAKNEDLKKPPTTVIVCKNKF